MLEIFVIVLSFVIVVLLTQNAILQRKRESQPIKVIYITNEDEMNQSTPYGCSLFLVSVIVIIGMASLLVIMF